MTKYQTRNFDSRNSAIYKEDVDKIITYGHNNMRCQLELQVDLGPSTPTSTSPVGPGSPW